MIGISSGATSRMSAPSYWTNALISGFQPLVRIRSVIRSRSFVQRAIRPGVPARGHADRRGRAPPRT